jgi:hypothetical protein
MSWTEAGPFQFPCIELMRAFCERGFDYDGDDSIGIPCGGNTCVRCGAEWVLQEVGATARALEESGGGNSIVLTVGSLEPGLAPEEVASFILPRLKDAVWRLRKRYATFEARATVELSRDEVPNVHILQHGSTPRKDALRAAFDAAGLGTRVDVEPIEHPLAMACYCSKLGLYSLRLGFSASASPLTLARTLNGGVGFEHHHPRFYGLGPAPFKSDVRAAGEPFMERVFEWVQGYPYFEDKLPARLLPELTAAEPGA